MLPFENYAYGSLDVVHEMITDPATVLGVADGGAHVGVICDASSPTSLLTLWGRDRTARAEARRSSSWSPSRRAAPPRPTASPTAACWRRATRPTSTSSTSTPRAQAPRGGLRPAGRRPPPDPARHRLPPHLQGRRRDGARRRADRRAAGWCRARASIVFPHSGSPRESTPLWTASMPMAQGFSAENSPTNPADLCPGEKHPCSGASVERLKCRCQRASFMRETRSAGAITS